MGVGPSLSLAGGTGLLVGALAGWPVGAVAAGVRRRSTARSETARWETARSETARSELVAEAGDTGRVFSWASVTKLLVALAVLVATEEGVLALDDPAGPPGSTVRHLLAHASGLGPDGSQVLAPPGQRRIYSNAGFEVLADTLARAAAMPFATYLSVGVLEPLAMTGTSLSPGASPAWGVRGPLRDLLALAGELQAPRLVDPATLAGAVEVAFPGLGGVLPGFGRFDPCDWGLGFELRDGKNPHWTGTHNSPATFGHFGQSGSFLWVDPDAGLACAVLCDRPFGPWAADAWPALADDVLAAFAGHPGRGDGDVGDTAPGAGERAPVA